MSSPPEFEDLADLLFPFAQDMLAQEGTFYPTAAFVNRDGRREFFAVYQGEHPDRDELYQAHLEAFRRDAAPRGYRATAICADGRAQHPRGGEKTDAILLFLEHVTGAAITVAMQYRRNAEGQYEFAETFAVRKEPEVFVE